jgi:hypothetical protein
MLSWIDGYVFRWAAVVATPIRDCIKWAVYALAGVVYAVFGNVGAAWTLIYDGINWVWTHSGNFAVEAVAWIKQIVTVDIPAVWNRLLAYAVAFDNLISQIWDKAVAAIADAYRRALQAVNDAISWVITHVYDPLKAYADQIYNDLLKWGYAAWQLLNDPGKLAGILLGALIAAAESAFWSIAAPVGKFALSIVLGNATKFASLLETILTAVL